MAQPFRRQHERFPCDIPVTLVAPTTATRIGDGRLVDVGSGGAALETPIRLQHGVPYEVYVQWGRQNLRLPCRLAWTGKPDPKNPKALRFGLSFTLTTTQESVYKALVDHVRRQLPGGDDKPIRDYWSV